MAKTAMINKNAIELLKELTQHRNWHNGMIERKYAHYIKNKLQEKGNGVSYKKACEILETIGYKKVKEETWSGPAD